jgi:hypothetical protein
MTTLSPEEYRWLKQIIERLNRTFKFSYQVTNGYGSGEGSNTHVALFVAYYNFLRPHPYTYWQPLNSISELESIPNMPGKWQKLIELSQQLILSKQADGLSVDDLTEIEIQDIRLPQSGFPENFRFRHRRRQKERFRS